MKYPKEYLDEIQLRLKVSQVVGQSVKLKKRGKEFIGLSPFSNEKTPSFTVSDEKGFYHCFSSGEHGNIFDFLIKTENLKFGEAVRRLAAEAGMPIYRFTKLDEEKEKKWKVYSSILEKYEILNYKELTSKKNQEAKKYLKMRKLNDDDVDYFKIGYVPLNNNFYEELKTNFESKEIIDSGLFYFDEKKQKYIERFKGRIIFPIKNINGSTIGFGGRIISNSKYAKYINSPETLYFKKGNNLFNINNVRKIKNENGEVLLVEGYMDVIALNKFGVKNVVANQGTALTKNQLELIWRFFKNPIICFDGDKSGREAGVRAAEGLFPLLKPEHNIFFLFLPDNLDPDSFIHKFGKDKFCNFIEEKITIYDFLWNYYFQNIKKNNPSELASFEKKIRNLCNQINDKSLNKYFKEYFLRKIASLTPLLNNKNINYRNYKNIFTPLPQTKILNKKREKFSERILKEYSLLYIIINSLSLFIKRIETISEISFSEKIFNDFKSKLINGLASDEVFDKSSFYDFFANSKFNDLISSIDEFAPVQLIFQKKTEKEILQLFEEISSELKKIDLNKQIANLEDKMIKEMDEKTYNQLLELKNQVKIG